MNAEIRAARAGEWQECVDLWCAVWGEESRAYFTRYFLGDIDWVPDYTTVAVCAGRIVSTAHIVRRIVACGDCRLTMGGIANVATLPEYRGRGYSTACLRRAIEVMGADAMDFSLLFTGIPAHYARLGYAPLEQSFPYGTLFDDGPALSGACLIRPVRAEDISVVERIYEIYNGNRPIAVQRTPAYWRDWIGLKTAPQSERSALGGPEGAVPAILQEGVLLLARVETGDAEGYIRYRFTEKSVHIDEFGVTGSERAQKALTQGLIDAVCSAARASGIQLLRATVPLEAAILAALQRHLALEMSTFAEGMARLLHREDLLRSLSPGWNDRWIQAGRPRGVLRFSTPYGPVAIDATGRLLQIGPTDVSAPAFPPQTFLQLLFGALTPERATDQHGLHALLAALFPQRNGIYWPEDRF